MEPHKPSSAQPIVSQTSVQTTEGSVRFDSITYTARPGRAEFGPSFSVLVCFLFMFGVFTLMLGGGALYRLMHLCAGLLDWLTNRPPDAGELWEDALLGLILIGPGLLVGSVVFDLLRFWLRPTVFDFAAGVFRRGGQEVCPLSDISAIHLRCITDPSYPGKEQLALAVERRDGSLDVLEPRCRFNRIGKRTHSFTVFASLLDAQQQQAARRVAEEVAQGIGVEVKERKEQGNLTPQKGM